MIQAYFYLENGPNDPLGEMEYWIVAVPRKGDRVTVSCTCEGETSGRKPLHGEVISVQWTFEKNEANNHPDYCTVDITLREL
jgi:hypothetical protein